MAETPMEPPTDALSDGSDARTSATREALKQMEQSMPHLQRLDPLSMLIISDEEFPSVLQTLVEQGSAPDRLMQSSFQHRVAYALQDMNKTPVGPLVLSDQGRAEMTRLAASAPGLENERMLKLMGITASIPEGHYDIIREIRIQGTYIGRQPDQTTEDVERRIALLENAVLRALTPPEAALAARNNATGAPASDADAAGRVTSGEAAVLPAVQGPPSPTAPLTESMASAQREALSTIGGRLTALRAEFDGTDDDSFNTRIELRHSISDLTHVANAIGRASGDRINLGRQILDYGYDPEEAAADHASGIEYVPAAEKEKQRHEVMISALTPTIESLRAAGFTVDTKVTFVEPPEYGEIQELEASDARTSATREALKQIEQSAPRLQESDPKFATALQTLVRQGSDPDQHWQPAFQHRVAYALQDMEKTPVGPVALSDESRTEMTRLAGSAEGLENQRMLALMSATASIAGNRGLIREIRINGADIGRQADQNTEEVESRVAALENKVRLAPTPSGPAQSAGNGAGGSANDAGLGAGTAQAGEGGAVQEVLKRMERMYPIVLSTDPKLAEQLEYVIRQGKDLERSTRPDFRHSVAYTLQDLERARGLMALSLETRSEMTRLAASAPGLENERILALMSVTASVGSQQIVNEIRKLAFETGRKADQATPETGRDIDRLWERINASGPSAAHDAGRAAQAPTETSSTRQPGGQPPQIYVQRTVLDTLLGGMRRPSSSNQDAALPGETPMAQRLAAFEKRTQDERDESTLQGTIKSGRAVLDALQAFNNGEGAAVMSRIRQAAKSEPGGMPTVLAEMREGGRFADLRQQFNGALVADRGLANAYDQAAAALSRYGSNRGAAQDILSRRADTSAIAGRLQEMDAEIGEAAASTPSRADGRSMIDDLAQKAAELLQRAVAAVKASFTGSPTATSQPTASPSMGMG